MAVKWPLSFCQQKKKASTKPHGRHVANKGGRSILFDPHGWNKTESKVSPVAVVSIKGSPHEQETRIVSVHSMEKLRRREEKRRRRKKKHKLMRKLKRWREQIYPASALGVSNYSENLMCLLMLDWSSWLRKCFVGWCRWRVCFYLN